MAEGFRHEHLVGLEWPLQICLRAGKSVHGKLGVEGAEGQRAFKGATPRYQVY